MTTTLLSRQHIRAGVAWAVTLGGGLGAALVAAPWVSTLPGLTLPLAVASVACVSATGIAVGMALSMQPSPPDGEVGDRAAVDAVIALLLCMGLVTLSGLVVVGRSNPVFFASAGIAGHASLFAYACHRTGNHPALLAVGPLVSAGLHLAVVVALYG